jgi:hypothetical protein
LGDTRKVEIGASAAPIDLAITYGLRKIRGRLPINPLVIIA